MHCLANFQAGFYINLPSDQVISIETTSFKCKDNCPFIIEIETLFLH